MGVLPSIKEYIDKSMKAKNILKKLNWSPYLLIVCAIAIIGLTYYKDRKGECEKKKIALTYEKNQEKLEGKLSDLGIKYDHNTGTIEYVKSKIDSLNNKPLREYPIIGDCGEWDRLTKISEDSFLFSPNFCGQNNYTVHNIRTRSIIIKKINDGLSVEDFGKGKMNNDNVVVSAVQKYSVDFGLKVEKYNNVDTIFIYIKHFYTDRYKNEMPPYENIYIVIPPLKNMISKMSDNKEFNRIKSYLQRKKYL